MKDTKYLISVQDVKANTNYQITIDDLNVQKFIDRAQQMDIMPELGQVIFDNLYLIASSDPAAEDLHPAYNTLYYMLVPAIANFTALKGYESLHFKLTPGGVTIKNSADSTPATGKDLERVWGNIKSDANFYMIKAIDYIKEKRDIFPTATCVSQSSRIGAGQVVFHRSNKGGITLRR
jgi:hypothetical protein